jgi:hypothetical protein
MFSLLNVEVTIQTSNLNPIITRPRWPSAKILRYGQTGIVARIRNVVFLPFSPARRDETAYISYTVLTFRKAVGSDILIFAGYIFHAESDFLVCFLALRALCIYNCLTSVLDNIVVLRRAIAEIKQHWSIIRWVTKNISSSSVL